MEEKEWQSPQKGNRFVSSRRGKAEVGDKRKVLSEANTKGGNSSERIYGWKRGRDGESQRG